MSDPYKGKYRKLYAEEFGLARGILAAYGGTFEWSKHDYQAFTYEKQGVKLVFYPHKTTAGNHHLRVRDQGSKDHVQAKKLLSLLDKGAGFNCTFTNNRRLK